MNTITSTPSFVSSIRIPETQTGSSTGGVLAAKDINSIILWSNRQKPAGMASSTSGGNRWMRSVVESYISPSGSAACIVEKHKFVVYNILSSDGSLQCTGVFEKGNYKY